MFYYCINGEDEYIEQFLLSYKTLRVVGLYDGIVYVFIDDKKKLDKYINLLNSKILNTDKLKIIELVHNRPLFTRYLAAKQLILNTSRTREDDTVDVYTYLDNDIIINKPVQEYMSNLTSSFYCYLEKNIVQPNYFNILNRNTQPIRANTFNSNSGLFSFTYKHFYIFNEILELEKTYTEEQYKQYGDQPVYAEILKKYSNNINSDLLNKYETLLNDLKYKNTSISLDKLPYTFIHYNLGFTLKGKLQLMNSDINNSLIIRSKIYN